MLNATDPIEKFASLCFIFSSFQQKLGPQAPWKEWHLWCCLNQLWWGVWTGSCYPPLGEDTWIADQPSIPLCRMARHFKLCCHHGSLLSPRKYTWVSFPSALGSHFLGTGSPDTGEDIQYSSPSGAYCLNPFSHCCPTPPTSGSWYVDAQSGSCGAGLLNWDHCVSVGDGVCLGEDPPS